MGDAETYSLARAVLLAWCNHPVSTPIAAEVLAAGAWSVAEAFVAEAKKRQPEAWKVLPAPSKEER